MGGQAGQDVAPFAGELAQTVPLGTHESQGNVNGSPCLVDGGCANEADYPIEA